MLWEVVGALCLPAIAYFLYDLRKHWRHAWLYLAAGGVLFACAWRLRFGVTHGRHYAILIPPLMLMLFHLLWTILPRWKWTAYVLLSILFAFCIGRDFRGRLQERKIMALYRNVAADAKKYRSPYGVSFPSAGVRESFYTGIPVGGIPYGGNAVGEFFRGLSGNLNIYRNSCDVFYLFISVRSDHPEMKNAIARLESEGAEVFGKEFLDRRHKKEIWVLKYEPRPENMDLRETSLLPNGDFSQFLTGEELKKGRERLGRRAPRFLLEKPDLPRQWGFYQSLTTFSNAIASIEQRESGKVLRMQADSYLVALSPSFEISRSRVMYFKIKANRTSNLLVRREFRNPKAVLSESVLLRIRPGDVGQYKLVLPDGAGKQIGRVWFWLTDGDIELSDVRIR